MKSLTSAIKRFWLILILIVILHQEEAPVGSAENYNEDVNVQNEHDVHKPLFVATDEWQEIHEGQKVPSGLHYRMNLETGKKEAKLIENDGYTEFKKVETTSSVVAVDENDSEEDEVKPME